LIKTLGSVAMRCYSHLSDDEREQIGLAKALGHSIGAIAGALPGLSQPAEHGAIHSASTGSICAD
jgi:hypothetical protein